jgi:hypothetical protein
MKRVKERYLCGLRDWAADRGALLVRVVLPTVALAAALIGWLAPSGPLRAQAGEVMVSGQVVNVTEGGAVPEEAPVLLRFFNEMSWTAVYTSTLAGGGDFRFDAGTFDDLDDHVGEDFVVQVTYQDVDYFSEPATLAPDPAAHTDIEVLIYEATEDAAAVQVDQAHFFIVPGEGSLRIAELYFVGNTGQRTYVGDLDAAGADVPADARTTLDFTLPPEIESLSFDGAGLGERFVGTPTSFADTRAVPPGTATVEVGFNYDIPFGDELRVTRELEVPVQSVLMVLRSERLSLVGAGLAFNGMLETQMGVAASYIAGPLAVGEILDFTIVNQPPEDATPGGAGAGAVTGEPAVARERDGTMEVLLGVGALVIAGVVGFALWQPHVVPEMPPEARRTVAEMARLDAAYERGEMDDAHYAATRAALKQELVTRLGRGTGGA